MYKNLTLKALKWEINPFVLYLFQGAIMTIRCFDTYYPGGSEKMEVFLESIMSGRYLFFAIKVTSYREPLNSILVI